MVECNLEQNKLDCNCSYPCDKKGMCCICLKYHKNRGELPACFFTVDIEKTYDRSVDNFIRSYNKR